MYTLEGTQVQANPYLFDRNVFTMLFTPNVEDVLSFTHGLQIENNFTNWFS